MDNTYTTTSAGKQMQLQEVIRQSDRIVSYMIIGLWLFGIAISVHYDTWALGLGMGTLLAALYFVSLKFFPGKLLTRMIGASVMAFYMIQYLAQLNGLYEMHFWFFIMPIFLIIYQDWLVYIPFAAIIVVHHVSIYILVRQGHAEYLQYFINMDELTDMTFFYHMGLAVLGVASGAAVSYRLFGQTSERLKGAQQLEAQLDQMKDMAMHVNQIASKITNKQSRNADMSMSDALMELGDDFRDIVDNILVEMQSVVDAAGKEGDFGVRLVTEDKNGVWLDLANSVNDLLDAISEPLMQINGIASKMSQGVLSDQFETDAKGAIRELFDNMKVGVQNLKHLLTQVAQGIEKIDSASTNMLTSGEEMDASTNEIASAIARMSTGAHNQLQDIERTSKVIESVLQSAKTSEEDAEQINLAAKQGYEVSEQGKSVVDVVVNDITRIQDFSGKTLDSINILSQRSGEISQMLNVINEIASQTNLLALNAAIEAAQAGENGRGFAVVADEIKKLAESAKDSTQQIERIVKDVQADTINAAQAMSEMNKNVESGVESTKRTHEILSIISQGSKKTLDLSHNIKELTKTQTQRISEVFESMESVVLISEQAATGAEEVASSASQLSNGMQDFNSHSKVLKKLGDELQASMDKFTLE